MKTKTWAKEEMAREFSECATLADLINYIQSGYSNEGEVICEVKVNGMILSETDEAKFALTPVAELESLSVKTSRVGNLLEEAKLSVTAYMHEMITVSTKVADHFRDGRFEDANTAFHALIEGTKWITEMFTELQRNRLILGFGSTTSGAEAGLLSVVQELLAAYEKKDYVLVADILEYDWTNSLQTWLDLLKGSNASDDRLQNSMGGSTAIGV